MRQGQIVGVDNEQFGVVRIAKTLSSRLRLRVG
jgi:hypothetical protein